MSDANAPESAAPASSSTAETAPVEPVRPAETVTPAAAPAAYAPVVVERKKRGVGAWSFVLGLLTGLVDIGFLVLAAVALVGVVAAISSGDLQAVTTAIGGAGLVFLALLVFFGGFVSAGVAALLGFIALVSGRGRVLGVFGLLFGLAAIAVRLFILGAGFTPDLG